MANLTRRTPNGTALARSQGERFRPISAHPGSLGLFAALTGFDLEAIPYMSNEQLAEIADAGRQWQELVAVLPDLEGHFKNMLEGRVQWESFLAQMQRAALQTGKQIDKLTAQNMVAWQSYQNSQRLTVQKAGLDSQLEDAHFRNDSEMATLNFQLALQSLAAQATAQRQGIAANQQRSAEVNRFKSALDRHRQERKDSAKYGSLASGMRGEGGGFGGGFGGSSATAPGPRRDGGMFGGVRRWLGF